MEAAKGDKPIEWQHITMVDEWVSIPYSQLAPSQTSMDGIRFCQMGEPLSIVHPALMAGYTFSLSELQDVLGDLNCELPESTTKESLLKALIEHVIPAGRQQEEFDACSGKKKKEEQPVLDTLKLVVDEMMQDPENQDEANAYKK